MRLKAVINVVIICVLINIFSFKSTSADILGRERQFDKLSVTEGLSNDYITTIFQDSKGYMWIGTQDGLNRYDGEVVKTYNADINSSNSLSSTYINVIVEDDFGNIWIGTDNGLDIIINNIYDVVRVKEYKNIKYNLGEVEITAILNTSYEENIMLVGTSNGLIKLNIETWEAEEFYNDEGDDNSLTNSYITCLEEDLYNCIWVGTKNGINIIDKDFKIAYSQTKIYENKLFIYDIGSNSLGEMWISTKEGIIICHINNVESMQIVILSSDGVKLYSFDEDKIESILENQYIDIYNNSFIMSDSKDNMWISSSDGIKVYFRDIMEMVEFKKDIKIQNDLYSNVITCFYEDINGVIWIGTDRGVNILTGNKQFNHTIRNDQGGGLLYDKDIMSILQHGEQIWVATKFNGIYIYNKAGDLITHLEKSDSEINLNDNYIKNMFSINNQFIIITTNKELLAIDTKNYSYTRDTYEQDYFYEVNYLYNDGEKIWTATEKDFYAYDINSEEKIYYSNELREANINPGNIKYIIADNKDNDIIWLSGSDTGVIKYSKENGIIKQYINDSSDKKSLISNNINCMTFDELGNLWIGTNMGLSKLDVVLEKFTSYTTAEGLINNFINSILPDKDNNIWISSNKGLSKLNLATKDIINFTEMDGIYGSKFNLRSSIICRDGTMMFGSTKGITYFKPEEIVEPEKTNDKVVIGDILIGKRKEVYDENELILEYDDKDLFIDYFLPDYSNLDNITYEYMIEGIDSDWIYVDSSSDLSIKFLEPGKYILKIRARDGHGNLTEETIMNMRVKNPIWKTPIAYLVYIFTVGVVVLYIFTYVKILRKLVNQKTMKLNNQLEENKRLSEEIINKEKFKNNYFVNLSHELRTPINVISSTVQLINTFNKEGSINKEKLSKYMQIISKNCESLLKIIGDIIDSSKIETGHYKINKENNDIVYIVEEAALNMSKYIEEKGLSLIIDPDMEEKVISCDATEIERCVINLLGNAVKFTPEGGEIYVFISEVNQYIEITVEDTGIGISEEDQEFIFKRFSQVDGANITKVSSSGIGLTLVKYIVELHGGYIRLESEVNSGSRFTIGLPSVLEE